MSRAVDNLLQAQHHAMSIRPPVGGFPYLAEVLRKAGVTRNIWHLPSCQSLYLTDLGPVVCVGMPLVNAPTDIPFFDTEALVKAIRVDQEGKSTFPEFLMAAWNAGVVRYEVDLVSRCVVYHGISGETYSENYVAVEIEASAL